MGMYVNYRGFREYRRRCGSGTGRRDWCDRHWREEESEDEDEDEGYSEV